MYKFLGLEFNKNKKLEDSLHAFLVSLTTYYKNFNSNFFVSESKKRATYRLNIDDPLPEGFKFEVWIQRGSKKIRLQVKDLSAGGVGVTIPFEDKNNYKQGSFVTILIDVQGMQIVTTATIKHARDSNPSRVMKDRFELLIAQVHPSDIGKEKIKEESKKEDKEKAC
jgi:hypothetical protein